MTRAQRWGLVSVGGPVALVAVVFGISRFVIGHDASRRACLAGLRACMAEGGEA